MEPRQGPSDRTEIRKRGKQGKTREGRTQGCVVERQCPACPLFFLFLHPPAVCACPSLRHAHSLPPRPTPPNVTRPRPYVPSSLSRLTRLIYPHAMPSRLRSRPLVLPPSLLFSRSARGTQTRTQTYGNGSAWPAAQHMTPRHGAKRGGRVVTGRAWTWT
jgi:hypothetical protein